MAAGFGAGIGALSGWVIDKLHKGRETVYPVVSPVPDQSAQRSRAVREVLARLSYRGATNLEGGSARAPDAVSRDDCVLRRSSQRSDVSGLRERLPARLAGSSHGRSRRQPRPDRRVAGCRGARHRVRRLERNRQPPAGTHDDPRTSSNGRRAAHRTAGRSRPRRRFPISREQPSSRVPAAP